MLHHDTLLYFLYFIYLIGSNYFWLFVSLFTCPVSAGGMPEGMMTVSGSLEAQPEPGKWFIEGVLSGEACEGLRKAGEGSGGKPCKKVFSGKI